LDFTALLAVGLFTLVGGAGARSLKIGPLMSVQSATSAIQRNPMVHLVGIRMQTGAVENCLARMQAPCQAGTRSEGIIDDVP
jgi:hypothetical protein